MGNNEISNNIYNGANPIGCVKLLVYCEDVAMENPTTVIASENSYTDEQEDNDQALLMYDYSSLQQLSKEEIQQIQNLYLIQRIGSLSLDMYNKLSHTQRVAFAKYAKGFHWLQEKDIPKLVQGIKSCNRLRLLHFHNRTEDFTEKYNLTDGDLLELFHSIEVDDVDINNSQLSYGQMKYGNQIIVFKKHGVHLSCGIDLSNIALYMKLDYSETTDSTIVYISIHDVVVKMR